MFSDQYEFFIDDLENKIALLKTNQDEIRLIRGDLKNLIDDLFVTLSQCINFRDIETRLDDLQKIDVETITKAADLFNQEDLLNSKFIFNNGKEVIVKDVFEELQKCLRTIQENEIKLGFLENLFRLEMLANSSFQQMISILGERAPTVELMKMVKDKLNILADGDVKILWSYIKEEFGDDDFKFKYIQGIIEKAFFNVKDAHELRDRIAEYITIKRPRILSERYKNGITASPIFSFGIARILAINKHYAKDLTLNEVAIIKIVSRISEFNNKVLYRKKSSLFEQLGISSEGRIASLRARDLDGGLDDGEFDFKSNEAKSYQLILYELRRLIKITNFYITYKTHLEKALFHYKLKYEIFAKENNYKFSRKNAPNELFLQKELCAYLLDRDIYSYGKLFGASQIDLISEQPAKTYVIETKIYKYAHKLETFERQIKKDYIQLCEYLDKESTSAYGILVIYNLTDVLITEPKQWINKRVWLLPINISKVTPSQRKKIIKIEEVSNKNLIQCILLNAETTKRKN